ncbi:hypothetical protein ACRALDRAFT_2017059 [Sodiomyces alcalophilus JCM 7366]|uniref:uncharacterized protein n=1 Tax=Sodiomyces alcalophilus JCM 7366 TaxID=591952 RepID=UPI0039B4FAB4
MSTPAAVNPNRVQSVTKWTMELEFTHHSVCGAVDVRPTRRGMDGTGTALPSTPSAHEAIGAGALSPVVNAADGGHGEWSADRSIHGRPGFFMIILPNLCTRKVAFVHDERVEQSDNSTSRRPRWTAPIKCAQLTRFRTLARANNVFSFLFLFFLSEIADSDELHTTYEFATTEFSPSHGTGAAASLLPARTHFFYIKTRLLGADQPTKETKKRVNDSEYPYLNEHGNITQNWLAHNATLSMLILKLPKDANEERNQPSIMCTASLYARCAPYIPDKSCPCLGWGNLGASGSSPIMQ